jgi:hypothetical protein
VSEFTVLISLDDFLAANRLFAKTRRQRRMLAIVLTIFAVVVLAEAIGPAVMSGRPTFGTIVASAITTLIFVFALWLAAQIIPRLIAPHLAKRRYAQLHLADDPITLLASEDGCTITTSTSRSFVDWSRFYGWIEDSHVLLLMRSENSYHIVPKGQVNPDSLDNFKRQIIAANVPTR